MNPAPCRFGQRGYTLVPLLAMAGVVLAGALYVWAAPRDDYALREQRTSAALALARDALIGRAASDNNRPGSLPCPDTDNDGDVDTSGGYCPAYIGRLPWRTLGLPDIRDGWGERLWYVLSPAFRDAGGGLNSDTPGLYVVRDAAGTTLVSDAPALVIAPGPALGSQSREASNQLVAAMYLEGENANGDPIYVARPVDATSNDRVMIITREELFRPVVARVAKEARQGLERYYATHRYYPAANPYAAGGPSFYCDPMTLRGRIPRTISGGNPATGCTTQAAWNSAPEMPGWFFDNGWHLLSHYAVSSVCTDTSAAGRAACAAGTGIELTVASAGAARFLVIVSGPARSGQDRPCANPADCVDDVVNADGDTRYARPAAWPASNDHMAGVCVGGIPCP